VRGFFRLWSNLMVDNRYYRQSTRQEIFSRVLHVWVTSILSLSLSLSEDTSSIMSLFHPFPGSWLHPFV